MSCDLLLSKISGVFSLIKNSAFSTILVTMLEISATTTSSSFCVLIYVTADSASCFRWFSTRSVRIYFFSASQNLILFAFSHKCKNYSAFYYTISFTLASLISSSLLSVV